MLLVAEAALGAEEIAALTKVVESGWITMGDRVRAFEQAFADHHGASDAVAVGSCTAGLHLALRARASVRATRFWCRRLHSSRR